MLGRRHPGRGLDHNRHIRVCSRLRPGSCIRVRALSVQHAWGRSYLHDDYHVGIGSDLVVAVAGLLHCHDGYLYNLGVRWKADMTWRSRLACYACLFS